MSNDQSELGVVLANAPRLEKAFGRKLAACIILVSLNFARRSSGLLGLFASLIFVFGLAIQAWFKIGGSSF